MSSAGYKVIFLGTPQFACPSLLALLESGLHVAAAVTQPDKPAGRGLGFSMSPVKQLALSRGLPVLQPEKVRAEEFLREVSSIDPDLAVVAAYGKILPPAFLAIPRLGCVNVHPSLLPKYRGAAPINWTIIRGESVTGISIMQLDEGMDSGDILLQREMQIGGDETAGSLHDRLASAGAALLSEALARLDEGALHGVPQDHSKATFAPMLNKEDGIIPWEKPAEELYDFIRGVTPWPGAFTYFKGRMLKVHKAAPGRKAASAEPGRVLDLRKDRLEVAAGGGSIHLLAVQEEGRKAMDVASFVRGHQDILKAKLEGKRKEDAP